MKKLLSFFSVVLIIAVLISSLSMLALPASAETEENYTYTVSDGEAKITDFPTTVTGEITIPDTLGGYPVTSIGKNAFLGCSWLTSITIPSSVKSIGDWAFGSCSGLTSIEISSSVTSIGYGAFYDCSGLERVTFESGSELESIGKYAFGSCSGLTSITIPSSVMSIGEYAFASCSGLTSIEIPSSVKSIGDCAFIDCSGLESISVELGNTKYHSNGNCLIETETGKLIAGCNTSVIPTDGSVIRIGTGAFYGCSGFTSITIPNSVKVIGYGAFYNCGGLTSITIPNSVTGIGPVAFDGCDDLTIYCYENSIAHTYAVDNDIKYTLIKANTQTPVAPIIQSQTATSVTLAPVEGYEYRVNDGEWQTSNVFEGLAAGQEYTFYQRIAGNLDTEASASSAAMRVILGALSDNNTKDENNQNTDLPTQGGDLTDLPESDTADATESPEQSSGCGSAIAGGAFIMISVLALGVGFIRKKED